MSIKLKIPKLEKGIRLEDIAKILVKDENKSVLVTHFREAEVDGLGGRIQILTDDDDDIVESLRNQLIKKEFEDLNISFNKKYIEILFYHGYRDAEMSWKYYNVDKTLFENLIKEFPEIEVLD